MRNTKKVKMKTLNYCGDSFAPKTTDKNRWHLLLANKLNAKIIGFGLQGSAHEHAIKSFNLAADITVFVWTEHSRVYKKDLPFGNITSITDRLREKSSAKWYKPFSTNKPEKIDSLMKLYYMYLYDDEFSEEKQIRDLYWFDNEVLSKYQGKAIHLFGFKQTYNFKHGITYDKILYDIARAAPSLPRSGKFSIPGNELVAKEVYNLIKN